MPPPLFFVHVPKTAGTSFTRSALKAFGPERCHFDYGVDDRHTTALVAEMAHQQQDLFRLNRRLLQQDAAMLAGHVPLERYAALFPSTRIVSFVREPLAQLRSHHAHIGRASGPVALEVFMRRRQGAGLQGRMLAGAPLAALGVIGVTERFADSLRLINAAYGIEMQALRVNEHPERAAGADPYDEIAPALRAELDLLLEPDRRLHAEAIRLLDARLAALDAGQPYVNGGITALTPQLLTGFAFEAEQPRRVRVRVLVNGEVVATLEATRMRPDLRALNVPRNGCVGFEHRFARPLRPDDLVELRVAPDGQALGRGRLSCDKLPS